MAAASGAWKWQCRVCEAIEVRIKERRTLDNPVIHSLVVQFISSYLCISEEATKALLHQDPTTKVLKRTYICRRLCLSYLEKIINIENKITELSTKVENITSSFLHKVSSTGLYQLVERDLPAAVIHPSPKQPRIAREQAVRSWFMSPKTSPAVRVGSQGCLLYCIIILHCILYMFQLDTRRNHVATLYKDRQSESAKPLHSIGVKSQHYVDYFIALA